MDAAVWQEVFRILTTKVPEFIYPKWFSYLADKIPVDSSRSRRDVPRFLSLLEAVALCLSFSDGRSQKRAIELNFADYCVAYHIFNEAFSSTYAGAHPMALQFAEAVRELYDRTKVPVLTNDVMGHLNWQKGVTHKWRMIAVQEKLVRYDGGTHPKNQKPLLPGPARQVTAFLPDPQLVFDECPEVGDEVRFINPISGNEGVLRRPVKKVKKTA
jgi:hypothetical protein